MRYVPTMMSGDDPADRYFPHPIDTDTHLGDSEWFPIVDGERYFAAVDDHLRTAGPGDTILASGLEIDPHIDLCGRDPEDPHYLPLGLHFAN